MGEPQREPEHQHGDRRPDEAAEDADSERAAIRSSTPYTTSASHDCATHRVPPAP